jgi:hypothetical protein
MVFSPSQIPSSLAHPKEEPITFLLITRHRSSRRVQLGGLVAATLGCRAVVGLSWPQQLPLGSMLTHVDAMAAYRAASRVSASLTSPDTSALAIGARRRIPDAGEYPGLPSWLYLADEQSGLRHRAAASAAARGHPRIDIETLGRDPWPRPISSKAASGNSGSWIGMDARPAVYCPTLMSAWCETLQIAAPPMRTISVCQRARQG